MKIELSGAARSVNRRVCDCGRAILSCVTYDATFIRIETFVCFCDSIKGASKHYIVRDRLAGIGRLGYQLEAVKTFSSTREFGFEHAFSFGSQLLQSSRIALLCIPTPVNTLSAVYRP